MTSQPAQPAYDPREHPAHIRATDTDREAVSALVQRAVDDGRLQLGEIDERLSAVYDAKTHGDLATVVDDIVPFRPPPPVAPAHPWTYAPVPAPRVSEKKILPAMLLGVPFGVFGAHRFYAGNIQTGVAMLVLTISGIGAPIAVFWWLADLLFMAMGWFRDGRDNAMKRWV